MGDVKYTNLTAGSDYYIAQYHREHVSGGEGDDILVANPTLNYDAHNWLGDAWNAITDFLGMNFNPSGGPPPFGFDISGRDVWLFGGKGNDTLISYGGSDLLDGGEGDDYIVAGDGNDVVFEEESQLGGNDFIYTGIGLHQVHAGSGNDRVVVTSLSDGDKFFGGTGSDTLVLDTQTTTWLDLAGNFVNGGALIDGFEVLNYYGGNGNDYVFASSGNDIISGGGAFDYLSGGAGQDTLNGGDGDDTLIGGEGNDRLTGGRGIDMLDGGTGSDTYAFINKADGLFTAGSFNPDLIVSFDDMQGGEQDVIDVSFIDANEKIAGNQAFFFDNGNGIVELGELIQSAFFDPTQGGALVRTLAADVTGDGSLDFVVKFNSLVTSLDAGDFIL